MDPFDFTEMTSDATRSSSSGVPHTQADQGTRLFGIIAAGALLAVALGFTFFGIPAVADYTAHQEQKREQQFQNELKRIS